MRKQSFCSMCCDFHIGIKYPKKRFNCKKRCNHVIKAKKKKNGLGVNNSKSLGNVNSRINPRSMMNVGSMSEGERSTNPVHNYNKNDLNE